MLGPGRDGYIFILLVIAVSLSCDLPKAMQSPQLESWNLNLGALGTKGTDRSGLCYGMLRKTFRSYSLHFKKLNIKNHFP